MAWRNRKGLLVNRENVEELFKRVDELEKKMQTLGVCYECGEVRAWRSFESTGGGLFDGAFRYLFDKHLCNKHAKEEVNKQRVCEWVKGNMGKVEELMREEGEGEKKEGNE